MLNSKFNNCKLFAILYKQLKSLQFKNEKLWSEYLIVNFAFLNYYYYLHFYISALCTNVIRPAQTNISKIKCPNLTNLQKFIFDKNIPTSPLLEGCRFGIISVGIKMQYSCIVVISRKISDSPGVKNRILSK